MKLARTRKMKVAKKNSKKASKKSTRKLKGGASGTKRKFGEIDMIPHSKFQPLIDAIGTPNILESLASILGREGLKSELGKNNSGGIASRIRKSTASIPDDFSGIIFDGVHWKGYEAKERNVSRVVYDSYAYDLQIEGTNNFCQSYAVFLWATRGKLSFEGTDLDIRFVPGQYTHNVKQMARLWLAWLETMLLDDDSRDWLMKAIPPPFNIGILRETMKTLSENDEEATAFSTSR